tara:strand:+ start:214 stop:552 length:339 start_codon:yes stop_codon:yes gene_type:complete
MKVKNIFLFLIFFLLISGCFQSTAMVGPAFTLVSTGNIAQAGFTYTANKAIEDETGMSPTEHLINTIEEKQAKYEEKKNIKKIKEDLIILVRNNFEKTRSKIINLKDSKLLN